MHRWLLWNGRIHDTSDKVFQPGQAGLLNGWGVFSTLRVHEGVLFAWERHYARMQHDAARMRVPFPEDADRLRSQLLELVRANDAWNATLRVAIIRNQGGSFDGPLIERDYDVVAFTKDLTAWGESVRLALVPDARHSASPFAGAKILSWSMNLTWLEEAQSRGFDEALLLDEHGRVSECTSANVFLVAGDRVWTPPLNSGCLPGVTRAILLEEIRLPGIDIGEQEVQVEELAEADDVFITSTTRNVLPVKEVEGTIMRGVGSVAARLKPALEALVHEYTSRHVRVA